MFWSKIDKKFCNQNMNMWSVLLIYYLRELLHIILYWFELRHRRIWYFWIISDKMKVHNFVPCKMVHYCFRQTDDVM